MPLTAEHKQMVREHFKILLGGACVSCGTVFNLEFHHKDGCGEGEGRGSERRLWMLYSEYHSNNLELRCKECHMKIHKPPFPGKKLKVELHE